MQLSILDLFILSLLDRGLETKYDLQRQGGVSVGSSTAVLRRLEAARLIRGRDDTGDSNRPRHHYELTASGRRAVRQGWQASLASAEELDIDAVLRMVDVAAHYGATPGEIATFLADAIAQRQSAPAVTRLGGDPQARIPLGYLSVRKRWDAARSEAEANFLTALATHWRRKSKRSPSSTP